jgi:hypothetical protein
MGNNVGEQPQKSGLYYRLSNTNDSSLVPFMNQSDRTKRMICLISLSVSSVVRKHVLEGNIGSRQTHVLN